MSPDFRKILLWLALAGLALFMWGNLSGSLAAKHDAALQAVFQDARAKIRHSHATIEQARQDARRSATVALGLSKAVKAGKGLADSLARIADSLRSTSQPVGTPSDSAAFERQLRLTVEGENRALRVALDSSQTLSGVWEAQSGRWQAVAEQADSVLKVAESSLTTLNKARVCRILFLPCPSRSASLLAGLLGGVAVGVLVSR